MDSGLTIKLKQPKPNIPRIVTAEFPVCKSKYNYLTLFERSVAIPLYNSFSLMFLFWEVELSRRTTLPDKTQKVSKVYFCG